MAELRFIGFDNHEHTIELIEAATTLNPATVTDAEIRAWADVVTDAIYHRYVRTLHWADVLFHPEDLQQEGRLALFIALRNWNRTQPPSRHWLRAVIVNHLIDYMRRRAFSRKDMLTSFHVDFDLYRQRETGQPGSDLNERCDVMAALKQLPEYDRRIVWWIGVEGKTHQQVADELLAKHKIQIDRSNVTRAYNRGLKKMRKILGKNYSATPSEDTGDNYAA